MRFQGRLPSEAEPGKFRYFAVPYETHDNLALAGVDADGFGWNVQERDGVRGETHAP